MHKIENISDIKNINDLESNVIKKGKFSEIKCPLTKNILLVRNCFSCKYCQKIRGKHQSKRSLTALICLYGSDIEDENK